MLGTVLTMTPTKGPDAYRYGYGYGYGESDGRPSAARTGRGASTSAVPPEAETSGEAAPMTKA